MLFGRQRSHAIHLRRPSPFRRASVPSDRITLTLPRRYLQNLPSRSTRVRSAFRGEWTVCQANPKSGAWVFAGWCPPDNRRVSVHVNEGYRVGAGQIR